MASELLNKWLTHYDPIHRGYTPMGIANGVSATLGWSFPRVAGGYNLYRGVGSGAVDFDQPVGAVGANATAVANFSWRPHAVDTTYSYVLKSVGGGGVESLASQAAVAAFDGVGGLLGPKPASPLSLDVTPGVGGRFVVSWVLDDRFGEATPTEFRVFHDNGSGTVDYATVVGQVSHVRGRVHYSFSSAAFAHGLRRVWGVRAVTSQGVDDGNVLAGFAWSDAVGPAAVEAVGLECLDEEQG